MYAAKPWFTARLSGIVRIAVERHIRPDAFTALGVGCAAAAALAVWRGWWLAAAVLLAMRLAGANLDGAVARARGIARPWGFVVNELGDRASDLLVFGGLAALASRLPHTSAVAPLDLVLLAATAATLPTFAALAAIGAGLPRRNGGPVGKTERCVLVVIATAWPSAIAVVCVTIIGGSLVTAGHRIGAARRELAIS